MAFTGIGLPLSVGGSGAISVPSDQIFSTTDERDSFFTNNPDKLVDKAQCIILTNPPEGLYQVYKLSVPEWEDRTAIVEGPQGAQGVSVSSAQIDASGNLIITLTSGEAVDCGRAKGEDGNLVYQQLDIATYGNFFSSDWGSLDTNIYGVTGLGNQFTNPPFPLNASTTYSFECMLVNEQSQYSLRVTPMVNADFENAGRDAILSGLTKTAAESIGWKVYAFLSDGGQGGDPGNGFKLKTSKAISSDDPQGSPTDIIIAGGIDPSGFPQSLLIGSRKLGLTLFTEGNGAYVEHDGGTGKILLEGEASGLVDRGVINELNRPFTELQEGKYYIDGWTEDAGLPQFDNPDRVGVLTVFGGYDGDVNGAYWHLASHRWGLYYNVRSAGVATGWIKVPRSLEDSFSNVTTYTSNDGLEYAQLNRETPVIATEDLDNLHIVRINGDSDGLNTVCKAVPGELASGFSLCPDGASQGDQIMQIASGQYKLEDIALSPDNFPFDADDVNYIYLSDAGDLTTDETEFRVGWVVPDGVIIDIDLYNSSINSDSSDAFDILTTRVLKVHKGPEEPDKFSQLTIDGNNNTNVHAVGDTHYYRKDPSSGDLTEVFQIDSADRFIVKTKIKVPVITNSSNGTTNSATDGAAYFDLSASNTTKIGAKAEIKASVDGNTIASFKGDSVSISGDLKFDSGNSVLFNSVGEGSIKNAGLMSRNDTNDRNSVNLGDGENTYKSDTHTFRNNDGTEIVNFSSEGQNLKNNNLKFVRHVVGNTPTSMFVANVSRIKRDDADNDKDVIDFDQDSITLKSKKLEIKDDTNSRRLTIENHKADWHSCQLNNILDGDADNDAATVGQLNAIAGIPYLRKFDSNGGNIYAHTYPEGRVQSWINYKGNGQSDLAIDSMRPIPEGQTGQMYDMIAVDNQGVNVCKLRLFYENNSVLLRVMPGEVVQCWTSREFKRWKWQYGTDASPTENNAFAIEENNDEIITPVDGEDFLLIDPDKSSGYGKDGKVTYFAPTVGTQSGTLLANLDYGKVFALHEDINSNKMIMIIHESLVSEIYGRDLTGVNDLTMLFTGNARGRLGKSNQTSGQQFCINWNGALIPKDNDANEENPSQWVSPDDSVTETWSTAVKSVCYSSGVLANRGSARLVRGDINYTKDPVESSSIVYDNNSEFFVMPIFCGGGTFNVIKIFQLFMERKTQYVEDWGSKRFDKSSDCIGTILKIAYDAAIAEEEREEMEKNDQLLEGLASGFLYAKQTKVG